LRPGASVGEANVPLLATTWWFFVSLFVHLTASPLLIATLAGLNPDALIFTVFVAVAAGLDAPATASASTVSAVNTSVRMLYPLGLRRLVLLPDAPGAKKFRLLTGPLQGRARAVRA